MNAFAQRGAGGCRLCHHIHEVFCKDIVAAKMGTALIDPVSFHDIIVMMIYGDNSCVEIKFNCTGITHEPCAALLGPFSDKEILGIDHMHSGIVFNDHTGAVVISSVFGKAAVFTDDVTVAVSFNVFRAFRAGDALITILAHQPGGLVSLEDLFGFHSTDPNRLQVS